MRRPSPAHAPQRGGPAEREKGRDPGGRPRQEVAETAAVAIAPRPGGAGGAWRRVRGRLGTI
ncbi:U2 Small Nuclear Ribonucleoprotein Auxiliary Factor 35 Kda Subunit-Related Protein 2 [Manis pentadactyla]|nr:U2 Small Nuclear Ribonucleoprotein Auxiliary Factor 35 Kda Subunit-Related Protein 2 [Manis pentadactyla]